MYNLIKLCNTSLIKSLSKTNVKLASFGRLRDKINVKQTFKQLLTPKAAGKLLKRHLPSSFIIGLSAIKVVQCQQKSGHKTKNISVVIKTKNDQQSFPWKEFFKLLQPYLLWLLGVVVAAVALAFINIKIPLLLGEVINVLVRFTSESNPAQDFLTEIYKPASRLVVMYGIQGLLTAACISMLFHVGENVAADMKQKLFHTIVVQDVGFFDDNKSSDLVHRLTIDLQEFKSSFKLCISQGLRNIVQTTGSVVSMMMISPTLTTYLVGLISFLISSGSLLGSGLRMLSRSAQEQASKSTLVAEEAISNVRTVRAFASEEHEIRHFQIETDKSSDLNKCLGYAIAAFQGISNIALNGLVLSTLCVGGLMMSRDEISAGALMSFLVASQAIQKSLDKLSVLYGATIQGINAGSRVFEFMLLDRGTTLGGRRTIQDCDLHCDLKFRDVSFAYPTRKEQPVLENFSLDIKGGQKVALVGPSGGGKSTVVSLLERFYDVDAGVITVDEIDLKELDPSWLRGKLIGFIGQEPVLFAATIRENIKYGKADATDEEVEEAARQANAHDFILSFPEGYETVLGERGQSVSGGQKQRIAIARALIKNPPILILDEATSALDVDSERLIQESIDNISKDRTVIIVAHRLSTIKNVDLVAVVVDGKIVEVGSPEQLKKCRGAFWGLIKDQH